MKSWHLPACWSLNLCPLPTFSPSQPWLPSPCGKPLPECLLDSQGPFPSVTAFRGTVEHHQVLSLSIQGCIFCMGAQWYQLGWGLCCRTIPGAPAEGGKFNDTRQKNPKKGQFPRNEGDFLQNFSCPSYFSPYFIYVSPAPPEFCVNL